MSKHIPVEWIALGKGVWVETVPAVGGPDPQPPEGEQIGEFNTPEQAEFAVTCVNACRGIENPGAIGEALDLVKALASPLAESLGLAAPDVVKQARAALAKLEVTP